MIRSTLGAPLGGTTRGGHQGVESLALSLITPPNCGGASGICLPLIVVVASAWPNVPVTCCAVAVVAASRNTAKKFETASAPSAGLRILTADFICSPYATSTAFVPIHTSEVHRASFSRLKSNPSTSHLTQRVENWG